MSSVPLLERAPSPREMMHLGDRSDLRGLMQLGLHIGLLGATGWLVAVAPGLLKLPGIVLLGMVQAALFATIHETTHYTAFRTRRLNAMVGWVAALPSLHNWHFYREFHLAHHRHTQDHKLDPELAIPEVRTLSDYVARFIGFGYWQARIEVIIAAWRSDLSAMPFVHAAVAPRLIQSIRAGSLAIPAIAIISGAIFGWEAPLLFWVLPQLLGQPILRLYLLTEHTGCTHDRNGLTNTRTILTNPIVRLLMWNMPFHAEHHLYPFIPFHRLDDAHTLLRHRLGNVAPGYVSWHRMFIRSLRRS